MLQTELNIDDNELNNIIDKMTMIVFTPYIIHLRNLMRDNKVRDNIRQHIINGKYNEKIVKNEFMNMLKEVIKQNE
jgi:hypothetical protein